MGSSTIKEIKYDPAKQEMEIEFFSGGTYRYHGVSQKAYEELESAESKGSHFHRHVKSNYRCVKVTQ